MNAPPISEATFMVEEACSAIIDPEMLDPETGVVPGTLGLAEEICATDSQPDNPAKKRNAIEAVENNLIKSQRLRQTPTNTEELIADS